MIASQLNYIIGYLMPDLTIKVEGLDKILAAMDKFPTQVARNMQQAGDEAAKRVLFKTTGILPYPPETAANQPPTPYYIRGRGTQLKSRNLGNSEKMGTLFYTEKSGVMDTIVGNRASYARYVVGTEQAHFMKPKGWRILFEVAEEKIGQITKVYQAWINKTIKDVGL